MIVGIGIGLQACGDVNPEESCGFVRNGQQQRVSWASSPVRVYVHKSVPQERWQDIQFAADHWNAVAAMPIIQIVSFGVDGNLNPKKDGFNLVTWHTHWDTTVDANNDGEADNSKTEQGRTTIHWSKSRIYESDIIVNADPRFFRYGAANLPGEHKVVDLASLMIHEFGHMLGLEHNEDHDSVMNSELDYGEKRGYTLDDNLNMHTDIRAVDINSMACEYEMAQ